MFVEKSIYYSKFSFKLGKNVLFCFERNCFFGKRRIYKASAEEVNLIVPHLGWDQSDKKWRKRIPIAEELVTFFHWSGAKRYISLQFHSPQFTGFFPISTIVDHLAADQILFEYFLSRKPIENTVLLPGDLSFAKSARKIAEKLGIGMIEMEKERKGRIKHNSSNLRQF